MELALVITGLLMGLAGAPHCAAMCGPACAVLLGRSGRPAAVGRAVQALPAAGTGVWWFHGMRVAGYALAGGLVAGGVGLLAWAGQAAPLVRPVWTLFHVAALVLGLWLAITARQPAWMTRVGRARAPGSLVMSVHAGRGGRSVLWIAKSSGLQSGLAGGLWVAWPCGLLQSAMVVAGLANTPGAGAAVMTAFALASGLGLQLTHAASARWLFGRTGPLGGRDLSRLVTRLAGTCLALGSLWALAHDALRQVWAYCFG